MADFAALQIATTTAERRRAQTDYFYHVELEPLPETPASLLYHALSQPDVEREWIQRLLRDVSNHVDICQYKDPSLGRTILHEACMMGSDLETVIQPLVEVVGVPVNATDREGRCPTGFAAEYGHFQLLQYLVERGGADPKSSDRRGRSWIHMASRQGQVPIVRYLLQHAQHHSGNVTTSAAALVRAKDYYGFTPLHMAADRGYVDTVQLLLEYGAPPEATELHYGRTPLFYACQQGHLDCVRALMEQGGAHVHATSAHGKTALWKALSHPDVLKYLVTHVADLEHRDDQNRTLLYQAVLDEKASAVQVLLEHGADELALVVESDATPGGGDNDDDEEELMDTPLFLAHELQDHNVLYWMVRLRPTMWDVLRKGCC